MKKENEFFEHVYRSWTRGGFLTGWLVGQDAKRRELVVLLEEAVAISLKRDKHSKNSTNVEQIIAMNCFTIIRRLFVRGCTFKVFVVYKEIEKLVIKRLASNPQAFGMHDIDSEIELEMEMVEKYCKPAIPPSDKVGIMPNEEDIYLK